MPLTAADLVLGVRDRRIERVDALTPPKSLIGSLQLGHARAEVVVQGRTDIHAILEGTADRLFVVVGPCSVHDARAALEYAELLAAKAEELRADLCVAMRVYFEKPRTTTGWKGLINDPKLDGSCDVDLGLKTARALLLQVLDLGLPIGCEFLDPITPQYISDTVAWGAIGARTTESQVHRQLGSGLSMPVGFKNRTDGNVQVAVDAVEAAASKHSFAGVAFNGDPAILHTTGNPDCHVILRGGDDEPNHDAGSVAAAQGLLRKKGLPERLVIDASHANSSKRQALQPKVAAAIGAQVADGALEIVGVMLESFLVAGNQKLTADLTYGQSITDECMDWDTTVEVLDGLAASVRARRAVV